MAETSRVPNRPDHLTGFGTETAGPTSQGGPSVMDKARDVASSVVGSVENAASAVKETAQNVASTVGHAARGAASAVGEGVSTGAGYARDTVSDAADDLTSLIRHYPVPALLVAFGVGLLVARATRR